MKSWLLIPPIAFSLIMLIVLLMSGLMKKVGFRGPLGPGAEKPYSCGEDMETIVLMAAMASSGFATATR